MQAGGRISRVAIFSFLLTLAPFHAQVVPGSAARFLRVAIDVGHSPINPGAYSARGTGEYAFNVQVANLLKDELSKSQNLQPIPVNSDGKDLTLSERADLINRIAPDILISVHHDSVQPGYLRKWTFGGKQADYCDKYSGFSVFYSGRNTKSAESLRLALLIGRAMVEEGLRPSLHHAEKIKGEKRQLMDREAGVYRFDQLLLLRSAECPAVLLECGIIKNRMDERCMLSRSFKLSIVSAIKKAVYEFNPN